MKQRTFLPEWHPQWGVLLAWPHPDTDWADNLAAAEACYRQIVCQISTRAHVLLLCHDEAHQQHIESQLKQAPHCRMEQIHPVQLPYNDTWARDFGPITVLEDDIPVLLDFTFTAWGGKFPAEHDNAVNAGLHRLGRLGAHRLETHGLVMEGGSLETDGLGTLLTTEACLLNPNRNPTLDKAMIEARLQAALGVSRILWLGNGYLEGDDTDAHIDTLARFASPDSIVYMSCDDPNDSHYPALRAMEHELRTLRQTRGEPYRLFPIPLGKARYLEGRRLAASYVNFLIINGAVLMPVYADEQADRIALEQMQAAFPHHQVIPVDCRPLIEQNGSLHCITLQLPAELLA